ncbi:MAG: hypothetical protein WCA32_19230 [Chromatiaceae bacterium]
MQFAADLGGQPVEPNEVDGEGVVGVLAAGLQSGVEVVAVDVLAGSVEGDEVRGVEMQLPWMDAHGLVRHRQGLPEGQ